MDNEVSYDKEQLSNFAELADIFYNTVVNRKSEIETYMANISNNWNGVLGNLVKKDIDNIKQTYRVCLEELYYKAGLLK